jgi:hypothetical protein
MDKKDVLYRVVYKNASSIKWGEITKIAGKETPQPTKDEVRNLLDDKNNTKMEAKLGMIHKGDKTELVLRIKNGSKHIYDKVLSKDFVRRSEMNLELSDKVQVSSLKEANEEIDDVFKQTETYGKSLKLYSTKLENVAKEHENTMTEVSPYKITTGIWVQLSTACNKRKRLIEALVQKAQSDLANHKKDIDPFRKGGVGRLGTKHGLHEDSIQTLVSRFADHSKLLYNVEQKLHNFEGKASRLIGEVARDLKFYDVNVDKATAVQEYLTSCLASWRQRQEEQSLIYYKGTDSYLKYSAARKDLPTVETGITFVESKIETSQKIYDKAVKQMTDVVNQVPKELLEKPATTKIAEQIEDLRLSWGLELDRYIVGCKRARDHLKKVQQEIVKQNKK